MEILKLKKLQDDFGNFRAWEIVGIPNVLLRQQDYGGSGREVLVIKSEGDTILTGSFQGPFKALKRLGLEKFHQFLESELRVHENTRTH